MTIKRLNTVEEEIQDYDPKKDFCELFTEIILDWQKSRKIEQSSHIPLTRLPLMYILHNHSTIIKTKKLTFAQYY